MPLQIIRDDITRVPCDAIVNAAKRSLLGGGGVDGAIHRAAGPGLLAECRTLGGCEPGQAKLTGAYALPAKYVIHTVGPVWMGGRRQERAVLESCYRESLRLAAEHGCESVAFPLIAAGTFGYPKHEALRTAVDAITDFLLDHDMTVYLVVYNKAAYRISKKLYADIKSYIDDVYVQERGPSEEVLQARRRAAMREERESMPAPPPEAYLGDAEDVESSILLPPAAPAPHVCHSMAAPSADASFSRAALREAIRRQKDESFSQMLLRLIDEKGMTDAACYKRANIDRKLFSKIRGDPQYRPSKPTAIAFAIALELSLEETREMLMKAGYALSDASEFDIIIEYFIRRGNYNIFEINEALFAFDQSLLGA